MHPLVKLPAAAVAIGAAGLTYSAGYEVRHFRLREVTIPCLPEDAPSVRVLHLSDAHLVPRQHRKRHWLESLAGLEPDMVINTGDNLGGQEALEVLEQTLGGLLDVPGAYVHGSNDYYAPVFKNPLRYFLPNGGEKRIHGSALPTAELDELLQSRGWIELDNARGELTFKGLRIALAGVDDPHLELDDGSSVAGAADSLADVRIAVAHAPYLRVLDQFAGDGYDVIFAGHTHGGQLRIPGYGALVTNCDLDRSRASGLATHEAGGHTSWLHVSAGCGTSPYAPYRFCCPPEATLATLVPRFDA